MTGVKKYTLNDFTNIINEGFIFKLPEITVELINDLSTKVGLTGNVNIPVFNKKEKDFTMTNDNEHKRKKNKRHDTQCESWDNFRSFQTTKIEQKVGIDAHITSIRLHLNKLTDKTFDSNCNSIIEIMDNILNDNVSDEDLIKIGNNIFDIASTNRFYSMLYSDLYAKILNRYANMKGIFNKNLDSYNKIFDNIEYVESSVDYNKFCLINETNEKRKALSNFYVNLVKNNVINKKHILNILRNIFLKIYVLINEENKKNEVDELVENVFILYDKNILTADDFEDDDLEIDGNEIPDLIDKYANSKAKDYVSLSNKSIFKFMDMLEE